MTPRRVHPFAQCSPPGVEAWGHRHDPVTAEAMASAVHYVWSTLRVTEREAFHRVNCLKLSNSQDRAVAERFREAVFARMEADQERYRENARGVLDFMDKAGVQVMTPVAGQQINLIVIRVRDEMALGEAPPSVRIRREITQCSKCGENCWIDKFSYEPGIPVPTCMRCVHPDMSDAIDKAIAERAAANGGN